MKDVRRLVKKYLDDGRVIQLATSRDDIPWLCNLYYVVDKDYKIYWLSYPNRRHSEDIEFNPNTAISIGVKQDLPVIGVQASGRSYRVKGLARIAKVMILYIKKYGVGREFVKNYRNKTNKHVMYCFEPRIIKLFDEQNFGHNSPQEIVFDKSN